MSKERTYWIKSGLFTFLEKGSIVLFGLGTFKILAMTLGPELLGKWFLFLGITTILEVARSGLIQNGLVRYLAICEKEDYSKILSASLMLNVLLTLLSSLFLLAVAQTLSVFFDNPDLSTMLYLYIATTICLIPFQQFNFIQQAKLSFSGIFWGNFTKQGLFFLFVLSFFIIGNSTTLIQLASFQIITAISGSLVAYFFAKKYLDFSRSIDWKWVKELFHYGKYTFGTNMSAQLHKNIDKWMLAPLIGNAAVGLYETCIKLTILIEVPTFSIAAIVFPKSAISSKEDSKAQIKQLYERAVGAIMAFTLPAIVFIFLFPKFIILLISSEDFLEATSLLRVVILYGLFFPFANQFGTILDSIGKPKINFTFVALGVVLNVIFNYIFIVNFGLVGAAYGTLLTYVITFLLNQIVLSRMFGVQFWKAFTYIPFFYKEAFQIIKEKIPTSKVEPLGIHSTEKEVLEK